MTRVEVDGLVRGVVADILPGTAAADIRADRHLKELGADSVDRVEIILALLDRLGLDEPLSSFSGLPDLGALVDTLTTLTAATLTAATLTVANGLAEVAGGNGHGAGE